MEEKAEYKVSSTNERICPICFTSFIYNNHNQRYCDDCREYRWEEIRHYQYEQHRQKELEKHKKSKSIDNIVADLNEYNERHGTLLSYGKYVALMEAGKLKD